MGLGLDSSNLHKKFLYVLRRKSQLLSIILVFSLFLGSQQLTYATALPSTEVFDYVSSSDFVKRKNEPLVFTCVFSPRVTPRNVTIQIFYPNQSCSHHNLVETEAKKYVNTSSFSQLGKYTFFATAIVNNKEMTSVSRSFWITTSLSDKDNDGMTDTWERFYGFNSSDKSDAYQDYDNDGFDNLEEFTMNTDPLEADYIEFILYYIDSNSHLIVLTLFFLLITLLCSILGLRRSTRWI